tara:strand:- start:6890 stop:10546 length:3657 start_codon:yes stop_codon:yes gene_type:complete
MAGKKVDGGTVTIKVTDGDSLKDIQKKVKKARGEFDGLSKSTQAADRAGKGLSKQSSNQTKNFSKMQQGISGGIVPAYATLAANVFALSAAFQFLQTSMNTKNMIEGQKAFGSITGVAYGTITDSIRKATQGQLAFKEAAEAAAIGTAAGLNRDQLERLGTAATNVSIALGRDLADSFNRLVRGVTKAEPELLDELGIVLRLDPALRAYAVAIGKSVTDLNQFEKSQAIANEVLGQAESKFGAIQEVMEPGAFALGQFTSAFNDLLDLLKNALGGIAQTVLPFFTENVAALASALALVAVPILKIILPNFDALSASAARNVDKTASSLNILQDELAQTSMASQALESGGADKMGAQGAAYSKGKLGKLGIQGKASDGSGNLSQRQVAAYRRTWNSKKGIWKKMTKQEQIDFKLSLDKMDMAHKASKGKQNITNTTSELKKQADHKKTEIKFKQGQLAMVRASKFAATAMNKALKAAGIIGIITMIGSAVMAAVNAFKKVDELEEARKEKMSENARVNTKIAEELERMLELRTKEVDRLRLVGKGEEGINELVKERIMLYNTDMNLQVGQALQSSALSAQARDYALGFDKNAPKEQKKTGEQRISTVRDVDGGTFSMPVFEDSNTFQGAQGKSQTNLAKSLGAMANLISDDFEFNTAGLGQSEQMVNAKDALLKFQEVIASGKELEIDQVKDLMQLESQYGSLASKVLLAGEVQKTYDKNLVKMGGKGRYGQAMRNSIAEMEGSLAAQRKVMEMNQENGIKDKEKEASLDAQDEKVSAFKDKVEQILALDTLIVDKRHEQAMAMQAAKVTRDFETNQTELLLKNEDKRIKGMETVKKLAEALASQAALGASATADDLADAAENVRIARQKVDLATEELRVQELLTAEIQKRNEINKFGQELSAMEKYVKLFRKARTDKLFQDNPFFGSMSKTTKGVIERKMFPDKAQTDYTASINKAQNQYDKTMAKDGISEMEKIIAQGTLDELTKIAQNTKTMAERTETERAVAEASMAGGKALESGMTTGLMSVAKGDKKAKDAAKDVALGVAEAILQSLIQSMVSNLLGDLLAKLALQLATETVTQTAMGGLGAIITANTAAVAYNSTQLLIGNVNPFARDGGVFEAGQRVKGYSSGGIANGSTSGYGAILHGREAVIPIPSGEKIPVEVKGGTQSNSIVNVTVNSDGSSSMDAEKANAFGKGIQAAVQQEISKQQRFGGLLSNT